MPKTATPKKRPTRRKASPKTGAKAGTKRPASRSSKTRGERKTAATRAILASKARAIQGLPGWKELGGGPKAPKRSARKGSAIDAVPSLRFGVLLILACVAVTLFVGHTFATKATLQDVQRAERENLRLRLTNQRLRGAFDRMTGPQAVMQAAEAAGLEQGIAYGTPITLDD